MIGTHTTFVGGSHKSVFPQIKREERKLMKICHKTGNPKRGKGGVQFSEVRSNIYSLLLIRSFNNLNNVSFSNNLSLKKEKQKLNEYFHRNLHHHHKAIFSGKQYAYFKSSLESHSIVTQSLYLLLVTTHSLFSKGQILIKFT